MKIKILILWLLVAPQILPAQSKFNDYFADGVFRFDFLLSGTDKSVRVIEVQQKMESQWGGTLKLPKDELNLGNYRFSIRDMVTKTLIYRRGFSPLFQEWQSTADAKKMERSFYQVIRFPYPRNKVTIDIECYDRKGIFEKIYSTVVDPSSYFVSREKAPDFEFTMLEKAGEPSKSVDIAILAEGYREEEMGRFVLDAKRLTDSLFRVEPFASQKMKFNVYALQTPSKESGTDIPGRNIYVNTLFNSTFYTFDIDRYLTTSDLKSVHDYAAAVPYDYVIVLVNSTQYGGGGFCNNISVCTAGHALSPQVFIHEFGHEFAGLGDEYYTSQVAYEDFYNLKLEPWEPNLTTMVNFKSKWAALVDPSTPIPTPRDAEFKDKVGVFEGGGYMAKGIFSPMEDCRMKSNKPDNFCPVCQDAIRKVIRSCTE